ncbi:mediator of RNA polymerase II transcription subunit 19a-like isoform X2 [Euphorbia lathyris]|uniref:mediator of RNA polymerase II transcription subunit 19a-like isoform X2 n=1 Tax=Euphorbia lathyris TaxID=212925 RepID=UPI00331334AD
MMDPESKKFGGGPRELCGAVDLINKFKLWPHHNFFCKRSLPLSISQSHYLQNVVGDREIKKGEGVELDQLSQNIPLLRDRNAYIRAFDIGLLREAFQVRETTQVVLPIAEKGFPTASMRSRRKSRKDKEKKHKILKNEKMDNDHTKVKLCDKDGSNEKYKKRSGLAPGPPENLKKQPDKRRRYNG